MFKEVAEGEEQDYYQAENDEITRLFELYICLFYVYELLVHKGYNRDDKPFNFMSGFPIQATRVVILANEPAGVDSFGYSFHGSDCESTRKLMTLINDDMGIFHDCLGLPSFKMTDDELEDAEDQCSLQGLIDQGVLFMNVRLTPDKDDLLQGAWEIFTDFLLEYMSAQPTPIVFLLAGYVAWEKESLIDHNINFCINVHHPGFYCYPDNIPQPEYDWSIKVPLINANFFIFQTIGRQHMIDWSSVTGLKEGKEGRLAALAMEFEFVLMFPRLYNPFTNHFLNLGEHSGRLVFHKQSHP